MDIIIEETQPSHQSLHDHNDDGETKEEASAVQALPALVVASSNGGSNGLQKRPRASLGLSSSSKKKGSVKKKARQQSLPSSGQSSSRAAKSTKTTTKRKAVKGRTSDGPSTPSSSSGASSLFGSRSNGSGGSQTPSGRGRQMTLGMTGTIATPMSISKHRHDEVMPCHMRVIRARMLMNHNHVDGCMIVDGCMSGV